MKLEIGRCLLQDRLDDAGYKSVELAQQLRCKPERLHDYMENKRIMPLKVAVSIAHLLECSVNELYEWFPTEVDLADGCTDNKEY